MLLASVEVFRFSRFYRVVLNEVGRCDPQEQRAADYVNYPISQSATPTSRNLAVKGSSDSRSTAHKQEEVSRHIQVFACPARHR